jgi:hypothetical protein
VGEQPVGDGAEDELARVAADEQVVVAVVEQFFAARPPAHEERALVGAAEQAERVKAGLAEAAGGADVEGGHGDVAEVVVVGRVDLVAGDGGAVDRVAKPFGEGDRL